MFNLPEILTIIIGSLLALIFIDGIRRSLRSKASSLKVELLDSSEIPDQDFQDEWLENYQTDEGDKFYETDSEELKQTEEKDEPNQTKTFGHSHQLLIINLSSNNGNLFSHNSINEALSPNTFVFDSRGYFVVNDQNNIPSFTILNGKKPGTFLGEEFSSYISMVFDPSSVTNPSEVLEQMYLLSLNLSDIFNSDLLDENRNLLTKQMYEHMKQQAQDLQRQKLASVS
jgi:FtsZ-interacting cell division protein ZipA|tara:strand:- start:1761 stop:2444 length:684 start_codon:yes stop_codon:yes gene_type:complete